MSECYCDYDSPQWFRERVGVARKAHRCCECGCDIRPGERYEYAVGQWDGDISTFKTCERCLSFRKWMVANFRCFCWSMGNLLQDARDLADDKAADAMDEAPGVLFAAGRKMVQINRRAAADFALRHPKRQGDRTNDSTGNPRA